MNQDPTHTPLPDPPEEQGVGAMKAVVIAAVGAGLLASGIAFARHAEHKAELRRAAQREAEKQAMLENAMRHYNNALNSPAIRNLDMISESLENSMYRY